MILSETISRSEENLSRQLDWVGRHDTKVSFTAGIVIGMLGYLISVSSEAYIFLAPLSYSLMWSILLLVSSLTCLYFSQYPRTNAPKHSNIFFGTIATMKINEFRNAFKQQTDEEYLDDVLNQIHVNAQILERKFFYLKAALVLMLLAVIPWCASLYFAGAFN